MAEAALKQNVANDDDKPKNKIGVADYLAAPRRKRKNFLLLAAGENFDPELSKAIVNQFRTQYPKFATATPRNREDFLRQFTRNVSLVVMDDEFLPLDQTIEVIKLLKERKRENKVPVLFLTRDPEKLVRIYQNSLADYYEHDDFLPIDLVARAQIFHAIKMGIENQFSRRWKRYKVEIPATIYILDQVKQRLGKITDFSPHGALLESVDGYVFSLKDQLRLHMNISAELKDPTIDIVRLTAKVKRLDISGTRASISWEFLAEEKKNLLGQLLSTLMEKHLAKQARATKTRLARIPQPTGR